VGLIMTDWDARYLDLAENVSSWSKDPSRKIGAVAVGSKGQILSQGYNGFPRGIDDSIERYNDKETKYRYVVHAEMNVVYNATYNGISLDGATLYVTGLPVCSECAKGIIQTGVKRVVMRATDVPEKWFVSFATTAKMFNEAGIEWELTE
jgi:dCMP deaminase